MLGWTLDAEAAGKKGKSKKKKRSSAHAVACKGMPYSGGGPFADVPRGHWAYEAIAKSVESGILQGWDNKYHGGKVVNRYQMAVVVARMLDRVGVIKGKGKIITAEDIANLESLTIEFADELALLNVKVSSLEDSVTALKKDVDLIKADLRGVGSRSGITGEMDARFVLTGDGANGWNHGAYLGTSAGTGAQQPNPSATTALTRYQGGAVSGVGTDASPYQYSGRQFATVANFALNIDREFDPKTHFHAQINVNAEGEQEGFGGWPGTGILGAGFHPFASSGSALFPAGLAAGRGSNFQFGLGGAAFADAFVNEAYVVFDDWFTSGVCGRVGIFALPMNTEVNGPSRTYVWTITPSIANSKWESIRPIGLDIFQNNDKDELAFYVGFFTPGDTSNGMFRSGTLLSAPTDSTYAYGGTAITAGGLAQIDLLGGRFPTPLGYAAMTDGPRGVSGQNLMTGDIGYYAQIGTHPTNRGHEGLNWHLAYLNRNGDLRPTSSDRISRTDWSAWQAAASYQWEKVLLSAQYYGATSKNYGISDFPAFALADTRRFNTTPFVNLLAQDTQSQSIMGFVNWKFAKRADATVRYEYAEDKTGLARLEADVWTFGANYRTSDHGWLQAEWIAPTTRSTSENGISNTSDINDDLVQINYKMNF